MEYRCAAGLTEWWPDRWPGWTLELWGDDYRRQSAICGGITLPEVDLSAAMSELAKRVDQYWPVASKMRAQVDDDMLQAMLRRNYGGIRSTLAANVTSRIGGNPAWLARSWKWSVTSAGCSCWPVAVVNTSRLGVRPSPAASSGGDTHRIRLNQRHATLNPDG
jgi:hypothetical protein